MTQRQALLVKPGELIPAKRIGRPFKIESPEMLSKLIDAYFDKTPVPNIMGLCLQLGVTREWLNHNENDSTSLFSDIIKKAKYILGDWTLSNAFKQRINPVFSMFYMKNVFNWIDRVDAPPINAQININLNFQDFLAKIPKPDVIETKLTK